MGCLDVVWCCERMMGFVLVFFASWRVARLGLDPMDCGLRGIVVLSFGSLLNVVDKSPKNVLFLLSR